jgi:stage III sporulation protein SpoIIIAA
MTHHFNETISILTESFRSKDIDIQIAYQLFKAEYEQSTGTSWSYEKFLQRAANWDFYGDEKGFITVRPQASGFVKLVGAAGSDKSKYKGFKELISKNLPVWGAVDSTILKLLQKLGYIKAPAILVKALIKTIGKNIFGGVDIIVNKDGSLTITYPDVGTVTKFFIGSPEYYKKLMSEIKLPPPVQWIILKILK